MRTKLCAAAVSVLGLGLLVAFAGCGDDDKGGSGSETLSKAQFTSRGNAACKKTNDAIDALDRPSNISEVEQYAGKTLAVTRGLREELGALKPPTADQAGFDRALQSLDEAISDLEEVRAAARAGDAEKVQDLGQQISDSPFDDRADAVGLGVCA